MATANDLDHIWGNRKILDLLDSLGLLTGGGSQTVTKTLSSANILSLGTTPVQLLAAPGANQVLLIDSWYAHYVAGATPYTLAADTDLTIVYAGMEAFDQWWSMSPTGFLDQASNRLRPGGLPAAVGLDLPSAFTDAQVANKALNFSNQSGTNDYTLGNGTLKVFVTYHTLSLV